MIDFRYHIVSLISVFLALAVGIILGAGPLQNAIGDQLTDQVASLRSERNDLRDQLSAANTDTRDSAQFIEAAGPQLVDGALTGRRVAVVELDGSDKDRYQAVTGELEAAGATVVGHVRLAEAWTRKSDESVRATVAGGLTDYLGTMPQNATADEKLARALALSLTGVSAQSMDVRSEAAVELSSQLVRLELIATEMEQSQPADLVVLISSGAPAVVAPSASATAAAKESTAYVVDLEATLADAAQEVSKAAIVVGPEAKTGDLISAIRADRDLAGTVSTVSGIDDTAGLICVPLALAARVADEVGQYGFEASATAVLPPAVHLPPVTSGTGEG